MPLINGSSGGAASGLAGILRGRYLTPVWAIAIERENSGDSSYFYSKEAALWLQPLPPHTLNLFCVCGCPSRRPSSPYLHASHVAGDERSARRSLVRDYVLSLLPVCRWWRCPVRNKKAPQTAQHVMTPVNTSALRLTISSTRQRRIPVCWG